MLVYAAKAISWMVFDLLGAPLTKNLPGLPFQIFFAALQQMSGDLFGLVADLARRHGGGGAGDGSAAAGVGSQTIGRGVGVAFLHGHVGCGNAQLLGDDLRVGRLMPLPLALGAHAARWPCRSDERESRSCRTS